MTENESTAAIERLKKLSLARWPKAEITPQVECVSEFPLVRPDGRGVDVAMLWAYLKKDLKQIREPNGMLSGLKGEDFELKTGIGRSVVQICTTKHQRLTDLWAQQADQIARILHTAKPKNLSLLTYGRQPMATPGQDQLTQKFASFSVLKTLEDAWLPFSTVAHERVRLTLPEPWRVPTLSLLQWLWPVFVSLFGNDQIMGGEDHYQNHLFLRQVLRAKNPAFQIALPPRFHKFEEWLSHTMNLSLLTERDDENWQVSHNDTFCNWMKNKEPDDERLWQHWNDHLPYTFTSAQFVQSGGIELRYVAQQPDAFRKALSALCLGVAYAHKEIWSYIYAFSPDDAVLDVRGLRTQQIFEQAMEHERDPKIALNRHLLEAIRVGLKARPAFTGLIEGVLQYATDALSVHQPGAQSSLQVLWDKLQSGQTNALRIRSDFAQRGMSVLLAQYLL